MDLASRAARDVGAYSTNDFTYFNWCTNNAIYWSDGKNMREIFSLDLATGTTQQVHKGNAGRTTVSADGKRAAWVMPPVCTRSWPSCSGRGQASSGRCWEAAMCTRRPWRESSGERSARAAERLTEVV
jgi:hypothetical protein